jgi:hypothetical protein
MPQMVYAVSPVDGGYDRPAVVFTTLDAVKAYTKWKPSDGAPDKYGVMWGVFKVWGPIPLDPSPSTGGRKKTVRHRRRTTRKH